MLLGLAVSPVLDVLFGGAEGSWSSSETSGLLAVLLKTVLALSPSFFAVRVELRVDLDADASTSAAAAARFLLGGIRTLFGRIRWHVSNSSMSTK